MITLAEMEKRSNNPLQKGIIRLYQEHSEILQGIPFKNIKGNAYTKKRELTLGGVGTRSVNEDYSDSTSTQERISENLKLMGGACKIDRFIIETETESDVVKEEIFSKVKASSMFFNKLFLKGDETADAEQFDGLENRISGDQVVDAGSTAGGDELTLDKLDELIDVVGKPSHLLMNAIMRRKVNTLMRGATQAFEYVKNDFGVLIPYYAGIPIVTVGVDNSFTEILPFNESDSAGDAALCTSIYAVRFGTDGVYGIQSRPPIIEDQGFIGNSKTLVIDWYNNFIVEHPKSAARLKAIIDV